MATTTEWIDYTERGSAPATPASTHWRLFFKSDGVYYVDDAGTVSGPLPSSALSNPMTTSGDIIYGGASGTPTRLAKGSDSQVLTLASGVPSWATPSVGTSGQQSVAPPLFMTPSAASTGGTAGRAYAMALSMAGKMKIRNLTIRVNTSAAGTVQWGLFDTSSNAASATKVAGGSAALGSTGWQTIAASSAPVSVAAGSYILIIHLPSSNQPSLFFDSGAGSPGYCKIQNSYTWTDTPNFTSGWSSEQVVFACYLRGDMDASNNQW